MQAASFPLPACGRPVRVNLKMVQSDSQTFLRELDKKLWTAADKLRSNLDAAVYKHAVLGLIFLKYVSDSFAQRQAEIEAMLKDPENDFFVDPAKGRSQADPFVIATAVCLGPDTVVVTGEKRRGNLAIPKIPDVCDAMGVRSMTFLEMLRELEFKF